VSCSPLPVQTRFARDLIIAGARGELLLVLSAFVIEEMRRNVDTKAPRAIPFLETFLSLELVQASIRPRRWCGRSPRTSRSRTHRSLPERSSTIGSIVIAIIDVVRSRKREKRQDVALTKSPSTAPQPPEATPAPKTSRRPAGYRNFAGSVRRICVEAVRKARSLLPGAGSPPPKT
jgi:hypothetical protein